MNEATLNYVRQHADDDVRMLALRGSKDEGVDMTIALQQIQGRQTARQKLPSWASLDAILYPPHLNMEQCSSEQTARYKADICRRLLQGYTGATSLVDLTGGFGVDFAWMSEAFAEATYVEQNSELFAISSSNFRILNRQVETLNTDGTDYLHNISHTTMIFLDPARRDSHGARTYGIGDCTPNVLELKDELLQKADVVMLKLSPMLDWRKAVSDLGETYVKEIHIVSVQNECKELLIVMQKEHVQSCSNNNVHSPVVHCVNDGVDFVVPEKILVQSTFSSPHVSQFLYEPHASIMKAGCFDALSVSFSVYPLAQNSHLFVSDQYVDAFPGRCFQITALSSMNKQELKNSFSDIRQANISVCNFPLSVAELRKKLKLGDGGETYIFATTLADGKRILLICKSLRSAK